MLWVNFRNYEDFVTAKLAQPVCPLFTYNQNGTNRLESGLTS